MFESHKLRPMVFTNYFLVGKKPLGIIIDLLCLFKIYYVWLIYIHLDFSGA